MRQVDIRGINGAFHLWHLECVMTIEIVFGFTPVSEQYRMPFNEAIEREFDV